MEQKKKSLRTFLLISNIVIALMCVASILGYLLMPLAAVKLTAEIDRDFITALKDSGALANSGALFSPELTVRGGNEVLPDTRLLSGSGSSGGQINLGDGVDLEMIAAALIEGLGDESIDIYVRFEITPFDALGSIPISDSAAAEMLIRHNVDRMTDELFIQYEGSKPAITRMTACLLKAVSEQAVANGFKAMENIVSEKLGYEDAAEFEKFSERIGLSNGYVKDEIGELVDDIGEGKMTPEDIAARAVAIYTGVFELAKADDDYGATVTERFEYDPDQFYNGILDWINNAEITDDSGHVSLDSAADQALFGDISKLIPDVEEEDLHVQHQSNAAGTTDASEPYGWAASTSGGNKSIEQQKEETKAMVKNKLMETLTADNMTGAYKAIHIMMIVAAALLLVAILSWFYLLIKILLKLGRPNPGVTLWVPIVFGWSLISLVALFPRIPFKILNNLVPGNFNDTVRQLASHLFLRFATGGLIAAICGIVLFIFSFVYASKRRQLNTMI
ncbi:MAG: hypothetical protein J5584_00435 [Clostridia bacterium]|nr:hypothetical protein [Clostridia bacterium]